MTFGKGCFFADFLKGPMYRFDFGSLRVRTQCPIKTADDNRTAADLREEEECLSGDRLFSQITFDYTAMRQCVPKFLLRRR